MPKVSIIMGVYNCEHTVAAALDSMLAQTCEDWEFIVCDDGSTDGTYAAVEAYCQRYPEKFVLLKNEVNLKLNKTLNRCIDVARGEYIARQDGDGDYSVPDRLAVQVAFLDAHPEFALVSGTMVSFDENGEWGKTVSPPEPAALDLLKESPFCHATCMVRAHALREVGGYSTGERYIRVEDYHLWYKLMKKGYRGYNMEKTLYYVLEDAGAVQRRTFQNRYNEFLLKREVMCGMNISRLYWPHVLRPLILYFLPEKLYEALHHWKMNRA